MYVSSISKEFQIPVDGRNPLPLEAVYQACVSGPHKAVNPHRQRLLVASHKKAKLDKTEKKVGNTKQHPNQAKAATPIPKEEQPKPTENPKQKKKTGATQRRSDTPYNIARKAFQAELLECVCVCRPSEVLLHLKILPPEIIPGLARWLGTRSNGGTATQAHPGLLSWGCASGGTCLTRRPRLCGACLWRSRRGVDTSESFAMLGPSSCGDFKGPPTRPIFSNLTQARGSNTRLLIFPGRNIEKDADRQPSPAGPCAFQTSPN